MEKDKIEPQILNKKKKKHPTFWNDRDGYTITDFIASSFTLFYLIMSSLMIYKSFTSEISTNQVQIYQTLTSTITIILGGYFGNQIAATVTNGIRGRHTEDITSQRENTLDTSYDSTQSLNNQVNKSNETYG